MNDLIESLPRPKSPAAEYIFNRLMTFLVFLQKDVDPKIWAAAAMIECNGLKPDVDQASVVRGVMNAAYLGLQFGTNLGHAHLVPFKGKVSLVIGYQGLCHLAYRTGYLQTVQAFVVHRGEKFEHWIDENGSHVRHVPNLDEVSTRQNVIHAYCIYRTNTGGSDVVVIPRSRIDKADKNRDVWVSNYGAMVKKTAIIAAAKYWNKTSALSHAIHLEEQTERDEPQDEPPAAELPKTVVEQPKLELEDFDAEFSADLAAKIKQEQTA